MGSNPTLSDSHTSSVTTSVAYLAERALPPKPDKVSRTSHSREVVRVKRRIATPQPCPHAVSGNPRRLRYLQAPFRAASLST